jgi:hypothetical protein
LTRLRHAARPDRRIGGCALLRELNNIIENDRFPLSARVRTLRGIRAKTPYGATDGTTCSATNTGRARPVAGTARIAAPANVKAGGQRPTVFPDGKAL